MKTITPFNFTMAEGKANDLIILYPFLIFTAVLCTIISCINWFYPHFGDLPFFLIGGLNIFLIGLLNYTNSKQLVGNLYLAIFVVILVKTSFHSGGIYSMDTLSLGFIPLMAIALIDHKSGITWLIFYIAYLWYMGLIIDSPEIDNYYRSQTLVYDKYYYILGGMVLAIFTSGFISIFYFQNRKLIAKLQAKEVMLKEHVSQLKEQSILLQKPRKI